MRFFLLLFFSLSSLYGQRSYLDPADQKKYFEAPALTLAELDLPPALAPWRQELMKVALQTRQKHGWLKYRFGSADPDKGGFDCSGAIYYVLNKAGYRPPRTSSDQYLWLREKGLLHSVNKEATDLQDPSFRFLKPGDLVFWSGTYRPTDGRQVPITHVALYLGIHKEGGQPVMICASKGRYFEGKRRDGYGLYDFKLPSKQSRAKLVAYGSLRD